MIKIKNFKLFYCWFILLYLIFVAYITVPFSVYAKETIHSANSNYSKQPLLRKTKISNSVAKLPSIMLYNGKPIEPYCFTLFGGGSERSTPIALKQCHRIGRKYESQATAVSTEKIIYRSDGFIGYYYTDKNNPTLLDKSYIYYKYLGVLKGLPVILSEYSTGGSGIFTDIVSFKRTKETISFVDLYVDGDRANGGITDAAILNGQLEYDQLVTPFDFIRLAKVIPAKQLASINLPDCANCAIATTHIAHRELTKVFWNESDTCKNNLFVTQSPEFSKQQNCFNKLFQQRYCKNFGQNKSEMNLQKIKQFTNEFYKQCLI